MALNKNVMMADTGGSVKKKQTGENAANAIAAAANKAKEGINSTVNPSTATAGGANPISTMLNNAAQQAAAGVQRGLASANDTIKKASNSGGSGSGGGSTPASTGSSAPAMQDVDPNNLLANPNIDGSLPQYQFSNDYGVQFNAPAADPQLQMQYQNAMAALEQMKGKAPTYGSQYDAQIQDLYNQIVGRGPFKYDSKTDPLYQQYVQDYTMNGKMAMRDTMGQAAALTGGYGSSYAQAVGQQAYDQYLQKMADILPETYGMALDAWNAEGDRQAQNLALTQQMEQNDYNRYLDELQQHNIDLNRAQTDADTAYNRMIQADETAYGRAVDQYNRDLTEAERKYGREADEYNRLLQENKLAYDRSMDAYDIDVANRTYNQRAQDAYYDRLLGLMSVGYTPTAQDYANAGLTVAQGAALESAYAPAPADTSSSAGNRIPPKGTTQPSSDADANFENLLMSALGVSTSTKKTGTGTAKGTGSNAATAVQDAVNKIKRQLK